MRLDITNTRALSLRPDTGTVSMKAVVSQGERGEQGLPGVGSAAWTATTAVTTGTVRQAPDGSWIKSTASRTTRATFDATEQTFWRSIGATPGTIEAADLSASIGATTVALTEDQESALSVLLADGYDERGVGTQVAPVVLPRLMTALRDWNDVTSTPIPVGGTGSSVGNAEGTGSSANAPVVYLGSALASELSPLGNVDWSVTNGSVNGSIVTEMGGTGYDDLKTAIGGPPKLLLIIPGMNDGGAGQYHAGQTFTGFRIYLQRAIRRARRDGADVIVATSPHPHTQRYNNAMPSATRSSGTTNGSPTVTCATAAAGDTGGLVTGAGIPANTYVGTVVPGVSYKLSSSPTSQVDVNATATATISATIYNAITYPASGNQTPGSSLAASNVTIDIGNGRSVEASYRHYRINDTIRQVCLEEGAVCLDAERYWFEAVYAVGQDALFGVAEFVHPNLLGHQLSYQRAIDALVRGMRRSIVGAATKPSRDRFELRLASNVTRTSTTTLTADPTLTFEAGAARRYTGVIAVHLTGSPGDLRVGLIVPSGTTGRLGGIGAAIDSASSTSAAAAVRSVAIPNVNGIDVGSNGVDAFAIFHFDITIGATAGDVSVAFSQSTSSGTATTIYAGTKLVLHAEN